MAAALENLFSRHVMVSLSDVSHGLGFYLNSYWGVVQQLPKPYK